MNNNLQNLISELNVTNDYSFVEEGYGIEPDRTVSIPVIKLSELGLKDMRSLTPQTVQTVAANNWIGDGIIAWSQTGHKLRFVFFRGKAAVVLEYHQDKDVEKTNLNELLRSATSLFSDRHYFSKKIVSMCA